MSIHQPKARERHPAAPSSASPDPARPPAGLVREHRRRSLFAYLTLSPTLAVVGLLMAYPLYVAIDLSLRGGQIADLLNLERNPLTLDNYRDVLTAPGLLSDVLRSVVYTVGVVVPAFALGLGLAILLNKAFPGRRIIRPLVLLPWAVPGVVVSAAFSWMLDASYGVVNHLLRTVGLIEDNVAWLADPDTALIAVILPTVWKYYPFFTLVLLAQLQSVPGELYEAARMDGASPLQQFLHVTWPAVRAASSLAIVITGIGVFREFDFIYPLTGGGPNEATQTLAIRIYNEAFQYFEMGTAAALGIVTMAICGLLLKFAGRSVRREFS
ncbi:MULTISPECIES: carbohydrate ABC transporter permease [Streptomyces]|uniref:carbohydrate ABC transporter permease n=1 Tax=Streptomyces TaxID=1883 RepID=UPI00067E3A4E|nr:MULTISPECIES: sugar ABC transporter permease [Streptomyces]MDX2917521.1 sugar ABC transporter permease [Streptomyces sp. NE06-03C]MDX3605700.1 sugar ABC transporter permease [Streptomyces sp. FL06-04B]MDX3736209.1 sugar ABC transporter permease [Streptomyces sp. ID01-15D]